MSLYGISCYADLKKACHIPGIDNLRVHNLVFLAKIKKLEK